jgi:transposase
VFQVHGIDEAGKVVARRRLSRARVLPFFEKLPRCLVGIEACNTSHHWARELIVLGHDVRLMPAQYVKPYVKRGKNDAADAEAICEAVTRPTMRFVAVKTPEQQSVMMLHRVRLMLNRQRTQLTNAMRAHLSEFGIVVPVGRMGVERLLEIIANHDDRRVPADARLCLEMLGAQLTVVKEQILDNDRRIRASARETEVGRRLMEIPGIGPLLASAFVASVADPTVFKTGRDLAAWIGLVPGRTQAAARSGWAASREPVTATCDKCWWSGRWPSSGMPNDTEPSEHGSCSCSPGARPRLLRWRSPTRPLAWSGH